MSQVGLCILWPCIMYKIKKKNKMVYLKCILILILHINQLINYKIQVIVHNFIFLSKIYNLFSIIFIGITIHSQTQIWDMIFGPQIFYLVPVFMASEWGERVIHTVRYCSNWYSLWNCFRPCKIWSLDVSINLLLSI